MSTDPRLIGPERWFAAVIRERQRTHRTPAIVRLESNYGPHGIALGSAAILSALIATVAVWSGIVLLVISGGAGGLLGVASTLLAVGIIFGVVAAIRAAQGILAGRRFRDGRPFVQG